MEDFKIKIQKCFSKIAKELFNPQTSPPVPHVVMQKDMIEETKDTARKGLTPSEHRRNLTASRTGIVGKNNQSNKAHRDFK